MQSQKLSYAGRVKKINYVDIKLNSYEERERENAGHKVLTTSILYVCSRNNTSNENSCEI